jgi:hypothetical protein
MRVLRFAAPLAVVGVVALAPVWLLALTAHPPTEVDQLGSFVRLGAMMVALAVVGQLALVGGAAAMIDSPSQAAALRRGFAGLGRAVVPCLLAAVAILAASLALVVPGVLALGLFATAGAAALASPGSAGARSSAEDGTAAAVLARAAADARPQLAAVTALAIAAVAIDVAIAAVAQRILLVMPAKPTPHDLAAAVGYARVVALALVAVSPPIAAALAVRYGKNRTR